MTTTGQWSCKSCGATFPSIRFDDDVDRCSQCVTVEVQGQRIAELKARAAFIDSGPSPMELDRRCGHFAAAMQELTARRAYDKVEIAQLLGEHKQRIAELEERVDLDVDEFQRVRAELADIEAGLHGAAAQALARCVYGLCDRAIAAGRQRVPLIEQRDRAQRELALARAQLAEAKEAPDA